MLEIILPSPEHRELVEKTVIILVTIMVFFFLVNLALAFLIYLTGKTGASIVADATTGGTGGGSRFLKMVTKKSSLLG